MIATIIILFFVCISLSYLCVRYRNERDDAISLYISETKKTIYYENKERLEQ